MAEQHMTTAPSATTTIATQKPAPAAAPSEKKVDALEAGKKAAADRANVAADTHEVVREKGGGLASNDIMAGNIAETITQPVGGAAKDTTRAARLMLRAAKAMAKHPGLGSLLGAADTWGLVGQGDEVVGHFVLIDLDSLDKVVVGDRWVINDDRVFANAQQWPKALIAGDTLKKVAGG